jgi:carbamoyltransferase
MIVLGLNRGDHDASAAIVRDGRLAAFINVERLTRKKHDGQCVWEAARYCQEAAGLTDDDIDLVVQNAYAVDLDESDALGPSRGVLPADTEFVRQFERVVTIPHHLAHAYCGVGLAPFDRCAVLVADGIGQYLPGGQAEAESYYAFRDGRLELIHRRVGSLKPDGQHFHSFDSVGGIYSMASSYIFGHWNLCGKVMGLAPYGRRRDRPSRIITAVDGHRLDFDLGFRRRLRNPHPKERDWERDREEFEDLAFHVQEETETALIRLTRWLQRETALDDLVFSGGLALNCVANQKILEQSGFERVFVPPPAGDDGIAIGCAFYGWFVHGRGGKTFSLTHPYYGRAYGDCEILDALAGEPLVTHRRLADVELEAAALLEQGKIVGWFQGASAMGPRALGDRSILADPRDAEIKRKVNDKVKHREAFRPFGASIPAERAREYFHCSDDKPYMTFAVRVRDEKRGEIPAVVHVDQTCRFQSVRQAEHPRFHRLLTLFGERTGVPVVLNTSFNTKGEPVVESPQDALRCLLRSDMDVLILGDHRVERRARWVGPGLEPELLSCRLVTGRQCTVMEQRYPGGLVEHSITAPLSERRIDLNRKALALLSFLDRPLTLGEALRRCEITGESPEDRVCMDTLWALVTEGWVRLSAART